MSSSKTFTYIGEKNLRVGPDGEHVEIIPRFRGYEFPKGKPVEVTDPVAIAKLSANPDFEEVKGGKGKSKDGGKGEGGQPDGAANPAA